LTAAETRLQDRLSSARADLSSLRSERDRVASSRDEMAQQAADLRAERSGLLSRTEVLENLERSHEGLGTAGREVFAHLEEPGPGPWGTVVGLVAELLTVRREFAPLIDLALGERAQRFVVADAGQLAEALRKRDQPFSGRVSFLHLDPAKASARTPSLAVTSGEFLSADGPAVPAELVVRCEDDRFADLPARLLGDVVIVRDLAAARAVAASNRRLRCITTSGELLEPDGTLTVGAHHA